MLYIPRGVPHVAHTDDGHVALHATVALAHRGATLSDLVEEECDRAQVDGGPWAKACSAWSQMRDQHTMVSPQSGLLRLFSLAADSRTASASPFEASSTDIVTQALEQIPRSYESMSNETVATLQQLLRPGSWRSPESTVSGRKPAKVAYLEPCRLITVMGVPQSLSRRRRATPWNYPTDGR